MKSGFFRRDMWASDEQVIEEAGELLTWGRIIGLHGGSEIEAIKAMERNEIEVRENTTGKGPKTLYCMFSQKGTSTIF